ncbi:shikimate kinase [Rossellomorea aquimaris]|uniref:shikimate kinase n=1 Tax=Rossellomorea aquimaris TaxID=189382 RepID=UPI0007D07FF3|nr:shikimate kinase [Rossellomorea aquimaris]
MKPIFFIGFMGVGKTTIGKRLSEVIQLPVIDMDQYIEEKEKQSIKEIFDQKGEAYFRDLETKALNELLVEEGIITTGGGVIEREENRKLLAGNPLVVHLTCPFDVLWGRLHGDENRPLVKKNSQENLRALYNRRIPFYTESSMIEIDTKDKTVETIVEEILLQLNP